MLHVPIFMMIKRLVTEYTAIISRMNNGTNEFNCTFPNELFNGPDIKRLIEQMNERLETFNLYF
jgi:hypothetical protein